MKFNCVICEQNGTVGRFRDETDLNAHVLFHHGVHRGYCENPNSKTHIDERWKLNGELKTLTNRLNKRKLDSETKYSTVVRVIQLIRRLYEIDAEIPKQTYHVEKLIRMYSTGSIEPASEYKNLIRSKKHWEEIDAETARITEELRK